MAVRGPIRRAFDLALRNSEANKRDQGAVLLARMYAEQLDDAAALHRASLEILADLDPGDVVTRRHVQQLADSVSARQCVIDIGPKFLAALAALHLTTAARVVAKTGDTGDSADPAAASLLRLVSDARVRNAPALDTAT